MTMKSKTILMAGLIGVCAFVVACGPGGKGGHKKHMDFAGMDTNGDGMISLAEFQATPHHADRAEKAAERFAGIDTNADGMLSQEELDAHHANHSRGSRKSDMAS